MVGSLILYSTVVEVLPLSTWKEVFNLFRMRTRWKPFIAYKGKYLSCPPPMTKENPSFDATIFFNEYPSTMLSQLNITPHMYGILKASINK